MISTKTKLKMMISFNKNYIMQQQRISLRILKTKRKRNQETEKLNK